MEKKNDNEFPCETGTHFKTEHSNTFEGRIPEVVQDETDALLHLERLGQQSQSYNEAAKRKNRKDYPLREVTQREQEAEEKKSLLMHLQVKPNALRYSSPVKVWTYYIVVLLGMGAEFFIYQSIAENAFGMPPFKSYITGMLVLLFTKFVQVAIQPHLKHWIKENNLLYKSVHKIVIFVFVGLILLNATMLGITNLHQINQTKKIEQIESLSTMIADAEESGEDTTELEAELNQLQGELGEKESGFFVIAKYLSIALIGLLAIGSGATLFVFAELYNDALQLKKKLQKEKNAQAEHRASREYLLTTYDDLLSLQKEILKLYEQKQFLEKLLSKQREQDMKIQTQK